MKKLLLALSLGTALLGQSPILPAAPGASDVAPVLVNYANIVRANYHDTLQSALRMQQAIDAFLAQPSAGTQQAAQQAWREAREFYGQTEAYRFYGGPIDDDDGPEGRLNAWPMDESYVDGVNGRDDAGLINNAAFVINTDNLIAQNERGGEENIATGWHAIEFLLWGQDMNVDGPGNRPYTDFVDGQAPNADRRREYLKTVTDLLVSDLNGLEKEWAPGRKFN